MFHPEGDKHVNDSGNAHIRNDCSCIDDKRHFGPKLLNENSTGPKHPRMQTNLVKDVHILLINDGDPDSSHHFMFSPSTKHHFCLVNTKSKQDHLHSGPCVRNIHTSNQSMDAQK